MQGVGFDGKGDSRTLQAPLDVINLHLRGGYVIVKQSPELTTTARYWKVYCTHVRCSVTTSGVTPVVSSSLLIGRCQFWFVKYILSSPEGILVLWGRIFSSGTDFSVSSLSLCVRGGAVLCVRARVRVCISVYTTVLYSRKNDFSLVVALSATQQAFGVLYLDDGVTIGKNTAQVHCQQFPSAGHCWKVKLFASVTF